MARARTSSEGEKTDALNSDGRESSSGTDPVVQSGQAFIARPGQEPDERDTGT
jgi:hypothetical protein